MSPKPIRFHINVLPPCIIFPFTFEVYTPPSTLLPPNTNAIDSDLTIVVKDAYNIFIDNGSPDSYLNSDVNNFINDSFFNVTLNQNSSAIYNGTDLNSDDNVTELIIMAVTSIVLGLMILATVIGNVFVIAAIILERNLQNVANYLVASLAVADLFVACLVMPLGAVYKISKGWILGPELCDVWTACDVLCCTASILHLVAIATDRYWAVTNVDYIHSRTSRRVFIMIFLVWFAALIVSLAPQFGLKDPEYMQRIEQQKCMVSQDVAYQVFATCCTFYVPLFVILVLYWKIYQTARKRIHRRQPLVINKNQNIPQKSKSRLRFCLAGKFTNPGKSAVSSLGLVDGNSTNTVNTVEDTEYSSNEKKTIEVTTFTNGEEVLLPSTTCQISTVSHQVESNLKPIVDTINIDENQIVQQANLTTLTNPPINHPPSSVRSSLHHQQNLLSPSQYSTLTQHQQIPIIITTTKASTIATTITTTTTTTVSTTTSSTNPHSQVRIRKETLEAKRERKAAKTLAIITGAFVVCWLPFFIMAILLPLCENCYVSDSVEAFFLWLGYFNSTLNPVIYTIFSPEFRQAFKRILFGTHRTGYYRGGKL